MVAAADPKAVTAAAIAIAKLVGADTSNGSMAASAAAATLAASGWVTLIECAVGTQNTAITKQASLSISGTAASAAAATLAASGWVTCDL